MIDMAPMRDAVYEAAVAAADQAVMAAADDARQFCSRRSGDLADSIDWTAEDTPTVLRRTLVATAEHASYQDEGTGIYGPRAERIYPTTPGGVLVFDWPAAGGTVFARSVAGSEPTRFFTRAVEGWEAHLADAVAEHLG